MSVRDKKILVLCLGILTFILAYYFPISSLMEETDKLRVENMQLVPKLAELQDKVLKEEEIKAETASIREQTEAAVRSFPSYLQVENELMDVLLLEKENKIGVTSITVGNPVPIPVEVQPQATEQAVTETDAAAEETQPTEEVEPAVTAATMYQLYDIQTTISYTGGYRNFKDFIEAISKSSDKKSINNVSVSFDASTGMLNGNIIYDSYYLAGNDRPYEEVMTEGVDKGTDNIFGTVDTAEPTKTDTDKE